MKKVLYTTGGRLVVAGGMALVLVLLVLGALSAAAKSNQAADRVEPPWPNLPEDTGQIALPLAAPSPKQGVAITPTPSIDTDFAWGQPPLKGATTSVRLPSLPGWVLEWRNDANRPIASSTATSVSVALSAETNHPDGDSFVYNGGRITYAITIINDSTDVITDVEIIDFLPLETLAEVGTANEVTCGSPCTVSHVVNSPTHIEWPSTQIAANGGSLRRVFSGTVVCQADGATFENEVLVTFNYQPGGDPGFVSDRIATTARVRIDPNGAAAMAAESPTWCSDEKFTWDLDWGDFDSDGYLDLALGASSDGLKVYHNNGGQLSFFWNDPRWTYGAFWVDVDNDGTLELVALGDSDAQGGLNYVYEPTADGFSQTDVFISEVSLYRAVAADYDLEDDYIELAAVRHYAGSVVPCQARLYDNEGTGFHYDDSTCLDSNSSKYWVASTAAGGDYDNDGDIDLAIVTSNGENRLYINNGGDFSTFVTFETFYPAFALDWGDYDGDSYLDLAAGFSTQKQVRVYHNRPADVGSGRQITTADYISISFTLPQSAVRGVGWGDFTGDGRLELAVGHSMPRIYQYRSSPPLTFAAIVTFPSNLFNSYSLWRARGVDHDNDGDLDLSFSNTDQYMWSGGPSLLFTNFAPLLRPTLAAIEPPAPFGFSPAGSVAWGDADGDGDLDLLFGAGPQGPAAGLKSKLYYNVNGRFLPENMVDFGFVGPHQVAFGDANGDGKLDIVLGTPFDNEVYLNGNTSAMPNFTFSSPGSARNSLAWSDADFDDNDGGLELLVGNGGANPNVLYASQEGSSGLTAVWTSKETEDTHSVAWGYYDDDKYLDFAVGNAGQPNQVYRNDGDRTFTAVWTSTATYDTRSVAWGDYDQDGDLDLAVGNYGGPNLIYENLRINDGGPAAPTLSATPVWTSTEVSHTTCLAWGDWNNDGDPDLAVGNLGQPDQVYANEGLKSGPPKLVWLWQSEESLQTTGIAWGDPDGDGDLDLAVSQDGDDKNGFYENTYVLAAHLDNDFARHMPLPNNPSYVSVQPPGRTPAADFFHSAELVSGPTTPTVRIHYMLFDPDGTRKSGTNEPGDGIASTRFEYSLDGGGTWHRASPANPTSPAVTTTMRRGQAAAFEWDAQKDEAISDDARFRITIVHQNRAGPVQRASTSAVSPPFRVRGLTCEWPEDPSIEYKTSGSLPQPNVPIEFTGDVAGGSGVLTFIWNFGDGTKEVSGQVVRHEYTKDDTYTVTLTVDGVPCPIPGRASSSRRISVGTAALDERVYLPLILKSSSGGTTACMLVRRPAQVTRLSGSSQPGDGVTHLAWKPNDASEAITRYRIYRRSRTEEGAFQLLATVPGSVTTYTDEAAACGYAYYVTALNPAGESPPSTASFFSLPCER
jgi:uncharacterized repeat protein (TIGR01451 family)